MARYIDLDKVAEHKNSYCNTTSITHCNHDCAECFYNNGGAEDVAPVIHAEWLPWERIYECSNCGFAPKDNNANFCPYCGAKMDGKMNNEPTYSYEEKIELYKQMETLEKLCGADNWERIENYWERLEEWGE